MWTCLKKKVIPMLGALISYMDTHNNLEILIRDGHESWQHRLWLDMLENAVITSFQYADIGKLNTVK